MGVMCWSATPRSGWRRRTCRSRQRSGARRRMPRPSSRRRRRRNRTMKSAVTNFENNTVGEIELAEAVFGLPVRKDILARMVNYQLNKRRSGNHKTKQIWEVSGTTKKPYKQKGTGHARQGSLRSAQFRGGGIIFGPVAWLRTTGPKKVRKLALKTALSAKLAEGRLVVLDAAKAETGKTRDLA